MALVAFGYYTDGWGSLEELLRRLDLDDVKGTLKKLPDDCKSINYLLTKVADRDLIEAGFRKEQIDMLKNEPLTLKQNPQGSAKVMPVVSGGGKTETRGEAYGDLIPLKEWRRAAGEAEHAKRALAERENKNSGGRLHRSTRTPPGVSRWLGQSGAAIFAIGRILKERRPNYIRCIRKKFWNHFRMTVGYWSTDMIDSFEIKALAYQYDDNPEDNEHNHQKVVQNVGISRSLFFQ